MNVGLVASVLWFLVAVGLAVSSALTGEPSQAALWGVVSVIALVFVSKMREEFGPVQV
ncbi:hypothetical protein ACFPYI_13580 [Halomarina salina]|uniref:Uncharacterized protein n=1 Tax=Halomarina salina TaxID=1872699 RepID=A0ABD5RPD1_9EURY|nr:hypothetical protein [Halomarina salina]